MAQGLRALGIAVEETPDGAVIHGGRIEARRVDRAGDHRCAMSLRVAGRWCARPVRSRLRERGDRRFPGFRRLARHVADCASTTAQACVAG
jgi:3-phosphoshikimate 1-carboxyvinyltransferase